MNHAPAASRWERIKTVLQVLDDLPAEQRTARLPELCDHDPSLIADVQALLIDDPGLSGALEGRALEGKALEGGALEGGAQALGGEHRPLHWPPGTWIDRYRIEREIGVGGMGVVYLATRVQADFSQQVALKALRPGFAASQMISRFQRERRILASLTHPNIARLIDGGSTEQGLPYLVLEYVQGVPWDRYLNDARPNLDQRLALFRKVLSAVSHAHQRLLVHRDLKPDNILVTPEGEPKLLDFGIARLLEGDGEDQALTRVQDRVLTPAWCAPEQIRGDPVTTATDVFSLGVILYQTLTGQHPFGHGQASQDQVLRAISSDDPVRPSRTGSAGPAGPSAALPLRRLQAQARDLDTIVLKALAKEPADRYESVQAFADDIARFEAGRPVRARPRTWTYVASRFLARNRLAVGLAGVAITGVLISTGLALWQAHLASEQRAVAERRFAQVRQFAGKVLFDYHEGIQRLNGSLPLQKQLVNDALAYLTALQKDAGADRELWSDIAGAYLKIGDVQGNPYLPNFGEFEAAAGSYSLALQALAQAGTGETRDFLRAKLLTRQAHNAFQLDRLPEADRLYREAAAQFAALPGSQGTHLERTLEHADMLGVHGDLLGLNRGPSLQDADGAQRRFDQSLQIIAAGLAKHPNDPWLLFARFSQMLRSAQLIWGRGDLARAEPAMRQAQTLIDALAQADPSNAIRQRELATVETSLCLLREEMGLLDEAANAGRRAHNLMTRMLEQDPANDTIREGVVQTALALSSVLIRLDRRDEAGPLIERMLETQTLRLKSTPDSPNLRNGMAVAQRRWAQLREAGGDLNGALAAYEKAFSIQIALAPANTEYAAQSAVTRMDVGRLLVRLNRLDAGQAALSEAQASLAALVAKAPDNTYFRESLAGTELAWGDALAGLATTANGEAIKAIKAPQGVANGAAKASDSTAGHGPANTQAHTHWRAAAAIYAQLSADGKTLTQDARSRAAGLRQRLDQRGPS